MGNIEVSEVRVHLQKNAKADESGIKATCSAVLNGQFVIHKILVILANSGELFIQFPQEKNKKTDKYQDICHPLNSETRNEIQKVVIDAYDKEVAKHANTTKDSGDGETQNN